MMSEHAYNFIITDTMLNVINLFIMRKCKWCHRKANLSEHGLCSDCEKTYCQIEVLDA